jgi:cell division protein FtsB
MKNFQKKNRQRTFLQSKFVLVVLGLLIITFSWSIIELAGKLQNTIENKKIAENKVKELQKEKEGLLYDIANLNTDKGVEESIRERFGLAKDGEEMIIIVDDKNSTETVNNKPGNKGLFSFLKNLFK